MSGMRGGPPGHLHVLGRQAWLSTGAARPRPWCGTGPEAVHGRAHLQGRSHTDRQTPLMGGDGTELMSVCTPVLRKGACGEVRTSL